MAQILPTPISLTWRNADLLDSLNRLHFLYGKWLGLKNFESETTPNAAPALSGFALQNINDAAFVSWWGLPTGSLNFFIRAAVSHVWLRLITQNQRLAIDAARTALMAENILFKDIAIDFSRIEIQTAISDLTPVILDIFNILGLSIQNEIQKVTDQKRIDGWLQAAVPNLSASEFKILSSMCEIIKLNKENKFTNRYIVAITNLTRESTKRALLSLQKKDFIGLNEERGRSTSYFAKII